jgi:ribosome assembly protein YihI (activator of Der GTPase)
MRKFDWEKIQQEIENKARRRQKRKKRNMKVSGASVRKLRNIIIKKAKIDK